jgi:hypothetical protein
MFIFYKELSSRKVPDRCHRRPSSPRKKFNELHFLWILELKRAMRSWRGRTEETLDAERLREHPNDCVAGDSG